MKDSITPAEIEYNGPEAVKREAQAEEAAAEIVVLMEYAALNVDACVDSFSYNLDFHDEIKELFVRAFSSKNPASEELGEDVCKLINTFKLEWAKSYRET